MAFEDWLAAEGTPHWWLAAHGWPTNFDDAEREDADHDGAFTWEEWQADTDPQSDESVLRVQMLSSNSPWRVGFPSSVERIYSLERVDALGSSEWSAVEGIVNIPGAGGLQVMAITNTTLDGFYRIRARVP